MNKRSFKFVILLILPIFYILFSIIYIKLSNPNVINRFYKEYSEIYLTNDEKVKVNQVIDFRNNIPKENKEYKYPLIYKFEFPFLLNDSGKIDIDEVPYSYRIGRNGIALYIFDNQQLSEFIKDLEKNNYTFSFSYECNYSDLLRYESNKNYLLLELRGNNKSRYNYSYLRLSEDMKILNKSKFIENNDENEYKINLRNKYKTYILKIDGNISKYRNIEIQNLIINDYVKDFIYYSYYILLILTIILLMTIIIAHYRNKVKDLPGSYEKDLNNLIDPILAETIIDNKLNLNNVIMIFLLNLIQKGNIENIDNDTIKLLNTNNLSKLENELLLILFCFQYDINDLDRLVGKTITLFRLKKVIDMI